MSFHSVTLRLVNERACSGDDLTFSCERATWSGLLVWDITALPGVPSVMQAFGRSLNTGRVTSTDATSGHNPSSITIQNVTAADNGATVQCRILVMELSNIITLSIRKWTANVDIPCVTVHHVFKHSSHHNFLLCILATSDYILIAVRIAHQTKTHGRLYGCVYVCVFIHKYGPL